MTDRGVRDSVESFNALVQSRLWLDFDVVASGPQTTVVDCGLDLTVGPEIRLEFSGVYFQTILMAWKTDTSRPVLKLLDAADAVRINSMYRIERGHHLFAFQPEDLAADARCIIAAKAIVWKSLPIN